MEQSRFDHQESWSWARDSLEFLRSMDPEGHLDCDAEVHKYLLNPTLAEDEIQSFEAEHRITLPADYRAFLKYVGNGGAGPAFGIPLLCQAIRESDLSEPFPLTQENHSESTQDDFLDRETETGLLPGVLCLSQRDYAWPSYLVVKGEAFGTIWGTGPSGDCFPNFPSFFHFYQEWVQHCFSRFSRYLRFSTPIEQWRTENESTWEKLWAVPQG